MERLQPKITKKNRKQSIEMSVIRGLADKGSPPVVIQCDGLTRPPGKL
jgi:hypothetical protein